MDYKSENFTFFEKAVLITLNVAGWIWDVVTFLPSYCFLGEKGPQTGQLQGSRVDGDPSLVYRNVNNIGGLYSGYKGAETLADLFRLAAEKFGTRKCLGTRQLFSEEDEIQPNGKIFKKLILGEYNWLTFREVRQRMDNIGKGLTAIGQKPKQSIILFAETKAEWMICAQACFSYNFPLATVYATLGDDALIHGINETESSVIITDAHLLPKLKSIYDQLHYVRAVVYIGDAKKGTLAGFPEVMPLAQVEEIGSKQDSSAEYSKPTAHDIAVIMYTSGSTGMPKGVLITHKNLMTAMYSGLFFVPNLSEQDIYIGYLPLAHVLELLSECTVLSCGACIGYSSALTLSDQSSKIKKGSKGDISVLRPTLMAAVPMIMDRIRKNVLDKVKDGPRLMQVLFTFAYCYKLKQLKAGKDTPLLNRLLFSKIRAILGGHVRLMLSGGAPLSTETEQFMNVCFCCPIGQGYGSTETAGVATVSAVWDTTTGRVGPPLVCTEVKLVSWEEGGYTVNDKPNPRGEIVIGGDNVGLGYLKQPELTEEVFVEELGQRWFYSGDIGMFHPDGCLEIVDRKKDLIKLSAGEYISLAKVESALKQSPYIDNCCVFGRSTESYVIVFIIPNPKHFKAFTETAGLEGTFEDLCHHELVEKEYLATVENYGKKGKLEKYEIPKKLKVCPEQWLPENELVTAAFKLKRKNIQNYYAADIERLYQG